MATHFSILAWKIPWAEEPGRLQSMELQESDTNERLTLTQGLNLMVKRMLFGWWYVLTQLHQKVFGHCVLFMPQSLPLRQSHTYSCIHLIYLLSPSSDPNLCSRGYLNETMSVMPVLLLRRGSSNAWEFRYHHLFLRFNAFHLLICQKLFLCK